MSNAETARQLVLGDEAVKTLVSRILDELELRDRVQAVILAYKSPVVGPGD